MMDTNDLPLGRLLANIARLQATRADKIMGQICLYRGQAILLLTLSDQDGLTHSEIAEKLHFSPAAATKVIKRLEKLNYLQRQPDPSDERVSRVFLQEEGRAVTQQIHNAFRQVNQIMMTGISAEEQAVLRGLLTRLYTNLQNIPVEKNVD
jgi:DNA-binding MarR family transcriptional regulator